MKTIFDEMEGYDAAVLKDSELSNDQHKKTGGRKPEFDLNDLLYYDEDGRDLSMSPEI